MSPFSPGATSGQTGIASGAAAGWAGAWPQVGAENERTRTQAAQRLKCVMRGRHSTGALRSLHTIRGPEDVMTQGREAEVFARRVDADWEMFCRGGGAGGDPFSSPGVATEPQELEPPPDREPEPARAVGRCTISMPRSWGCPIRTPTARIAARQSLPC